MLGELYSAIICQCDAWLIFNVIYFDPPLSKKGFTSGTSAPHQYGVSGQFEISPYYDQIHAQRCDIDLTAC